MSSQQELLIDKYKSKGILIDANLALLYLVGSYDLRLVGDGKYKKLAKYNYEDYRLLLRLKNVFKKAVTTPHVLTDSKQSRERPAGKNEVFMFEEIL